MRDKYYSVSYDTMTILIVNKVFVWKRTFIWQLQSLKKMFPMRSVICTFSNVLKLLFLDSYYQHQEQIRVVLLIKSVKMSIFLNNISLITCIITGNKTIRGFTLFLANNPCYHWWLKRMIIYQWINGINLK